MKCNKIPCGKYPFCNRWHLCLMDEPIDSALFGKNLVHKIIPHCRPIEPEIKKVVNTKPLPTKKHADSREKYEKYVEDLARKNINRIYIRRRYKVYIRDNFKCVNCGTEENLTIDHIVPVSKGGTNKESNLQTLCTDCNHFKGDKLLKIPFKVELIK